MGYNFLDHPPRVARTIFRDPEPEPATPAAETPAVAPAPTFDSTAVGALLFRTLKRFPEAYHAVVDALREMSPDLAPA